jgi:hypothetical protein
VKDEGLVAEHKKVVEGEASARRDVGHIGRDAIDAVRDLVDLGFHLILPLAIQDDLKLTLTRHCARSEAIQKNLAALRTLDCFVARSSQ